MDNCKCNQKKLASVIFKNISNNIDPCYAKYGDSGFDLRAWIDNDNKSITLKPLERALIRTGLFFEVPSNTEMQIRPRSGNALNYGITVLNSPATIDEQYRGEICVALINLSDKEFVVNNGDRIAQGVICPVFNSHEVSLVRVEEIDKNTDRGEEGFGHTGKI